MGPRREAPKDLKTVNQIPLSKISLSNNVHALPTVDIDTVLPQTVQELIHLDLSIFTCSLFIVESVQFSSVTDRDIRKYQH